MICWRGSAIVSSTRSRASTVSPTMSLANRRERLSGNEVNVRHKTKDKGDLGVAKTIPHLLAHGIHCCVPLSEHLPFDLIAVMPDVTTLRRIQVKYRKIARRGCIELNFRSNYYDAKRIYS